MGSWPGFLVQILICAPYLFHKTKCQCCLSVYWVQVCAYGDHWRVWDKDTWALIGLCSHQCRLGLNPTLSPKRENGKTLVPFSDTGADLQAEEYQQPFCRTVCFDVKPTVRKNRQNSERQHIVKCKWFPLQSFHWARMFIIGTNC